MKRALGALLASALFFATGMAAAGTCVGRPTDPAGFLGYSYGTDTVSMFDGARVRIHYTVTGQHAVVTTSTRADMVPDSVAFAAMTGDTALTTYSQWGYATPPDDLACPSNGGDGKTDIYLVDFASADGTTTADNCTGRSCGSFVLCESTFIGRGYATTSDGFRTVITHELFHTIQNGYDQSLDRFWAEGTAQWAMKTINPDLTDFENHLPGFFSENTRSIDSPPTGVTADFLYGSAVWPLFLTLHEGPNTVRSVIEKEADGTESLAAVDAVLMESGSSLAETYPVFAAWNAATKALAGTAGYPESAIYPGITTLPLADGATAINSGFGYYVYRGTIDNLEISIDTDATRNGAVIVPVIDGKAAVDMIESLPSVVSGDVLVVVAGISTLKTDAPFTVHIGAPTTTSDAGTSSGGDTSTTTSSGGCGVAERSLTSVASSIAGGLLGLCLLACITRRRTRSCAREEDHS